MFTILIAVVRYFFTNHPIETAFAVLFVLSWIRGCRKKRLKRLAAQAAGK